MDTRDPRFVSAYNDLVNAFFRFINVVNPAPTRSDQIRLICDSMTSLVNMLQSAPEEEYEKNRSVTPTPPPVERGMSDMASPQPTVPHLQSAPRMSEESKESYSEKRFAKEPTLTGDEVNKFLNKQLKREIPVDPDIDPNEYIFMLEFDPETEKGIYYLNTDVDLASVFNGSVEPEVVKLQGSPKINDYAIVSYGKIEKSTGGWEVVGPLVISEKR